MNQQIGEADKALQMSLAVEHQQAGYPRLTIISPARSTGQSGGTNCTGAVHHVAHLSFGWSILSDNPQRMSRSVYHTDGLGIGVAHRQQPELWKAINWRSARRSRLGGSMYGPDS